MKKIIFGLVAGMAMLVSGTGLAHADWIAVAMNSHGSGFSPGYDEEDARAGAIYACEQRTGYDCSWTTTSVPSSWYLVGLYCGGEPTTAGSQYSEHQAKVNAANKLGVRLSRCRTVWSE